MRVRPAIGDDIPALPPLMRAYCDFYESDPPDEGLAEMGGPSQNPVARLNDGPRGESIGGRR